MISLNLSANLSLRLTTANSSLAGGGLRLRVDADESSFATFFFEFDHACDPGIQRIVAADADVVAWLEPCATLTHYDRATVNQLTTKSLDA